MLMNVQQQDNDSQILQEKPSVQFNPLESRNLPSSGSVEQPAVKLGIEASQRWPRGRSLHLANLRAQIEAGTYKVESKVLAACMIGNETHFFKIQTH
jgi:anti-sigma28 factor (negative regulator of flagellin synthesis)